MPTTALVERLRPLYGFVDPHGGQASLLATRLKRVASQAAICVGGQDDLGRIFILDAWAGRVSTDDLIERMYATHELWGLKTLGGEANGLQALFQDAVLRDTRLRNRPLPLVKVLQPTTQQKDYRIRTTLQPLVGNGRLFIREDLVALMTQLTDFPLSPHKDLIDCCASLCRLLPIRAPRHDADAERQAKLAYLRQIGAEPWEIAETARTGRFPEGATSRH